MHDHTSISPHWHQAKQSAWHRLETLAKQQASRLNIAEQLNDSAHRARFRFELQSAATPLLFADLSKHLINEEIWQALLDLAEACDLENKIASLLRGDPINFTEQRAAHHTLLRDMTQPKAQQRHPEVHAVFQRMQRLADTCRARNIKQVIHIGIGGSDLGPRLAVEALQSTRANQRPSPPLDVHFVANIDPIELHHVLQQCRPEESLVVVCSKSFGTLETIKNAKMTFDWLGRERIEQQVVAVTNNLERAKALGIHETQILPMWDWVGGRYSLWSTIGFTLMLAIGSEGFTALLKGAHTVDRHFAEKTLDKNLPVALALIGIWYHNFLGAQTHCIIPYDHLLSRFPSYIQQLDMESNGKSTDQWGAKTHYTTGPIIWGNSGCNSQHSFHQLFHQGTHLAPIDFLLPLQSAIATTPEQQSSHHWLIANCLGQSDALVYGQSLNEVTQQLIASGRSQADAEALAPHKTVPGNRPHSIIGYHSTTPETLGALLALYEHKTFIQGVIWSINSFDQWGVELGKQLANPIYNALSCPPDNSDGTLTAPSQHDTLSPTLSPATSEFISRYFAHAHPLHDSDETKGQLSSPTPTPTPTSVKNDKV